MRHRRSLGAAIGVVLIASLLTAAPGAGRAGPNRATASGEGLPRTVTLITGDRVTVHPQGGISIQPRDNVRFLTYSRPGHRYVIPSDVVPLLRDDRLDRRLFDITALLAAGYDRHDSPPLLITGAEHGSARALSTSAQWRTLAAQPGTKVWLDGIRKPALDATVPQIGAPAAWAAGFNGTGIKVAVLDTGIDATHPDLAGRVAAAHNFVAADEDGRDLIGHGTHVASTVARVAPGAALLDGKVCEQRGCRESAILAGMRWAAESGAQVVNLSLGGDDDPAIDPLEQAVNDLTAQHGTLFVIAAGNSGERGGYTVGSPASAAAALAVGAVDKADVLAAFSSRGPRVGDAGVKPEITAPGVDVVAARGKDAHLGDPGEAYVSLSGTSMATPHVAGAAAILSQQHPQWTAEQLKSALTGSAQPNPADGPFAQGAGRLDVARAVTATVSSDPATAGFGVQAWPHEDDPVLTRDVTYRNHGALDVTLRLALTDAADGVFSLGSASLTVPAGGSATVRLTADTRQGNAIGPIGGRIVATGDGGVRVQTPYGVDREGQRHTVQFVHTDRSGNPAGQYLTAALDLETFKEYRVDDPDGTGEIRVPAGTYFVYSWIDSPTDTTQLIWPRLQVNADQTITLDARTADGYRVSIPDKTRTPLLSSVDAALVAEETSAGIVVPTSFDHIFTAQLGPKPVAGLTVSVQSIWGRKTDGRIDPSPIHMLAWQQEGALYQGFDRDVRPEELTTVRQHAASAGPGHGAVVRYPVVPGSAFVIHVPQELPAVSTHVINTELPWHVEFRDILFDPEGFPYPISSAFEEAKRYEPGRTYHESFNRAVFGPALPPTRVPFCWVSRDGDEILMFAPVSGDGQGRAGFTVTANQRIALYRDGELVGVEPSGEAAFRVPAADARYRLEVSAERRAPFRLGTRVSVAWSFRSSHVDGVRRLPVTAIGFRPALDDHNAARTGSHLLIPIDVRQQTGSDAAKLVRLTVAASHDDGVTWHDVKVYDVLGHRFVLLANPAAPGFVSLRAQAEDRAGNTVEQTIIRAYEVR